MLPSADELFKASWSCQSPSSAPMLPDKYINGFWPDICRRAIEWARQGITAEQLADEVAKAKAEYDEYWEGLKDKAKARAIEPPANPELTASILSEIGDLF